MNFTLPSDELSLLSVQFFLIFVRMAALTFFLPGFGESYVSPRVKLVVAIGMTTLVFPIIGPGILVDPSNQRQFLGIIGIEAITGIFWGVIIRLIVFSLQIAGAIISQATSLAQIFGGSVNMDAQPAMGHILVISGLALICVLGLHEVFIVYVLNTYLVTPVGLAIPGADIANYGSDHIGRAFALGFQLAAAALTATLLYNIILGVINRAMPQLLVSFVGAPAITAGGLLILYLMAPIMLNVWLSFVEDIIAIPETP